MAGIPGFGDLKTRNRSVDEVSAYNCDTMNVWQTLEVISGNNLRKRFHYEGYSDAANVLRTLTPSSHRRDSFVDKANSPEEEKKFGSNNSETKNEQEDTEVVHPPKEIIEKTTRSYGKERKKKLKSEKVLFDSAEKDELLKLTLECTDLVKCSFNIPRISARLERLMGSNVVRLTDRKYMKDLRDRIDEEYIMQLSNRIKNREIKELERERNLILEGKTDAIPDELAADPIFVVNKRANVEIVKRRGKLKTNREKNAERLLRQGLKWERERQRYEEEERIRQKELARIKKEQNALQEQYQEEDAERGLDLLRINDTEWQDCEHTLREFLESERSKMKERSWLVPTPYSSDPQDIENIIRARKKFRKTEQRLRLQLEASAASRSKKARTPKSVIARASMILSAVSALSKQKYGEESESHVSIHSGDDEVSGSSTSLHQDTGPSMKEVKEQKAKEMEAHIETNIEKGHFPTIDQISSRWDDPDIARLQNASNIKELYQIAEKIILGENGDEFIPIEEMDVEDTDEDND